MTHRPEGFADLADYAEDERIAITAHYVVAHGKIVAVVVDDDAETVGRYVTKLEATPGVLVIDVGPGPIAGAVVIRVGPTPPPPPDSPS